METDELIVPQTKELSKIVSDSGLELNEGERIKQSYLPYFEQLAEIKEQAKKINFENPTELDEKIARELRLKTVKIRTGSESVKDERKKIHSLKANLEQSAWNLIKHTCQLEEETFLQVEKRREIIERQRQDALRTERGNILQEYAEFIPQGLDLGRMTDEDFSKLLNGAKMQFNAKQEAIAKAEAERLERERIDALHRSRKEVLLEDWQHVPADDKSENFGEYSDDQWTALLAVTQANKQAWGRAQERIRIENERLKAEAEAAAKAKAEAEAKARKEREAAEKKLAEERAKAEAERKAAEEKAHREREAAMAKARKEREQLEAKLKAEAEAKAKLEAELKAKAEAEEKERLAKIAAEKKAAAAPDKEKLIEYIKLLESPWPDVKTEEAKAILVTASNHIAEGVRWIKHSIEQM